MSSPSLFLHIGMHKTGTTYLQNVVFPQIPGVYFVKNNTKYKDFFLNYQYQNKILVSYEGMSGQPDDGNWFENFHDNLSKLKDLFPNAGVIMGVREHKSLLKSIYNQHLHAGGTKSFEEYIYSNNERKYIFDYNDLSFQERIKLIQKYFDNLYIFTFTDFKENFYGCLEGFENFLGLPNGEIIDKEFENQQANKSVGLLQGRLLRKLNKIDNNLKKIPGLPTLNNKFFKKLNIHPRGLCQIRLKNLDNRSLNIEDSLPSDWIQFIEEDWNWTLNFIRNQNCQPGSQKNNE